MVVCKCIFLLLHFFVFENQPKDTQQALSRKESAVNMEKFKKFAARRKWKVCAFFFLRLYSFHTLRAEIQASHILPKLVS